MNLIKKMIKKIKKKLIKKVYLKKYYYKDKNIIFSLKLVNFISKKNLRAIMEFGEKKIPLNRYITKNNLFIKIPVEEFKQIDKTVSIILYNKNQKLIVTPTKQYNAMKNDIIINNKLYYSTVKKNIVISHVFKQILFNSKEIALNIINTSYESIKFEVNEPMSLVQMFAIKGSKILPLQTLHNQNSSTIELKNFDLFTKGTWRLYIGIEGYLHSIILNNEDEILFDTKSHEIQIIEKNKKAYFHIKPRRIICSQLTISKLDSNYLKLKFKNKQNVKLNHESLYFIIEDTTTKKEEKIIVEKYEEQFIININYDKLLNTIVKKRFFIETISKEPKKYQFNLNNAEISITTQNLYKEWYGEYLLLNFYKRKDKSLGLIIKRPKINKEVYKINNFVIEGFIDNLSMFKNVKPFLRLEEKQTEKKVEIPITNNFLIDLSKINLLSIKTKSKTVLDFFIVIKNENNEIIRKEKIKYLDTEYKKDNYLDYKKLVENKMEHHFLITITPFHNLKLESFEIPRKIDKLISFKEKDENIWLIGERYDTAQDNGIVFYNWLKRNTNIEAYYVIEETAKDYNKIKYDKNVLIFGSDKHYEIALKAKVLIGTHDLENLLPYKSAPGFYGYENTFKVFLQHGVLGRKRVEYNKFYYQDPFDLIIVSSDAEKQNIVMNQWGYKEKEVVVTGLARFDNLKQEKKPKDILLMPTWRDWINTDARFYSSRYYRLYLSLIQNKHLIEVLEKNNVNLHFYPHYRAQSYFEKEISKIKSISDKIKFVPLGYKSVQELLIDHALLITDYSSVSFDFILMNKPVIYYHFDVKRFFKYGSLRPLNETFIGYTAYEEEEVVNLIEDRINNDFANYNVDISGVFKYQDHHNCERIYKAIKQKLIE